MKKIVILASGRGSNAFAFYQKQKELGYSISAIISDNKDALVLTKARDWGIKTLLVEKMSGETRMMHEKKLIDELYQLDFHLIVLAGYERLLSSYFLNQFAPETIVNIHPSLLPDYPGLHSYQRAFRDGVKKSGISIHYVDEGVDTGKIIAQYAFNLEASDNLDTFQEKGLKLEHQHYPEQVAKILNLKTTYRIEVYPLDKRFVQNPDHLKIKTFGLELDGPCALLKKVSKEVIADSVVEEIFLYQGPELINHFHLLGIDQKTGFLDVSFLPGVTDNTAASTQEALLKHPHFKQSQFKLSSGTLHVLKDSSESELKIRAYKELANTWLEKAQSQSFEQIISGQRFKEATFPHVELSSHEVQHFDLNVPDELLLQMSAKNLWALNLAELHFIRDYFHSQKRFPTDVEMEIIAQTWSEHCKHKIFAAHIEHVDEDGKREIKSLFKTFIKGATSKIIEDRKIDWARSVFTDNAGIVRWDSKLDVCIKVETHNSPSALDPYGGALTGILGVNRDILGCGLGAKPIANTNVFCLPPIDADQSGDWPSELHSPLRLRQGVHKGVQDGGNKSGIPTVNGAFHYDLSYAGKPLVYCGSIGVLPHSIGGRESHEKNQKVHDLVVMVGGKIGKDGIHGATFSSEELKEGTPSTVVQIGDPLTQKRVTDFLLRARDLGLYSSITDNGAGGLSSSVGEMAGGTNGAIIDVALAPVKYKGLSAAELIISESQERMTCSVPVKEWEEFKQLADTFKVEVSNLGIFTNDGFFTVLNQGKVVAKLPLTFLHEDLPPMKLKSTWKKNYERVTWKETIDQKLPLTLTDKIYELLTHPNIRSHENFVRQYDHEVKASSVTKPFTMQGGPSDAGVLAMKAHGGGEKNGIVISSGLAPQVSLQDTKLMAMYAIDEAVRNAVVTGADPDQMVLIDNFCWPDPLPSQQNPDFSQKLGELVRCNEGLYEMATVLGMPFVSGKDSMKNDAVVNFRQKTTKISVLPTLLVTCMGHMHDINQTVHSRFDVQEDLWLLGGTEVLNPHTLRSLSGLKRSEWPHTKPEILKLRYQAFHKAIRQNLICGAHDVSEGGLLLALIEMAINSELGFDLSFPQEDEQLFGEGMGMIVFSGRLSEREKIQHHFGQVKLIGSTRSDLHIKINGQQIDLAACKSAYQGLKA
ncbi:MAG: phosphoribosylglycinamide formyltransferase [Bacteriovoracaceae bacterium]